jgi:glucose repression mediator protein
VQDQDKALRAFETALKHNPNSVLALNAVASIARSRDDFDKAIEYFQRILNIKQDNGEVWGSMGEELNIPMPVVMLTKLRTLSVDEGRSSKSIHCLPTSALPSPKPKGKYLKSLAIPLLTFQQEPKLWYGIGILYDRYGSFEHAEEAFSSVLRMEPSKSSSFASIHLLTSRLRESQRDLFQAGYHLQTTAKIYQQSRRMFVLRYSADHQCFKYILDNPPRPLTSWDIWFQLGHVYEQDGKVS